MNDSSRPANALPRALTALVMIAVPLAAFLAFAIQPAMGKRLLPVYGGTPVTWLGCMVYFQLMLLLGYTWAAWLVRKSIALQVTATIGLAVLAALTFHLPSAEADGTASILRVVWQLSFASLPAMLLLFSTAPLLHGWMRSRGEEVPYYLYSVSNAGSLVAVLLYPFFIEPALGLSAQAGYWHGLLIAFALVLIAAAVILKRLTPATAAAAAEASEPLSWSRAGLWLWLSALTCVGMLGATYHLAAELGSEPLAWVGPFSAYLLSFLIAFSGRWRPWMTFTTIAWLAISLSGFMIAKGFAAVTVNGSTAWWLLSLTASGSILGNALLYQLRPAVRFERYYLIIAAGGVLGGVLSSVVIPALLSRPIEFPLASVALLVTGLLWLTGRRDPATVLVVAIVLAAPVIGVGGRHISDETRGVRLQHHRDLYGHIMVRTDHRSVVLSSETTTAGSQLTTDAAARKRPTLYFTESTAVGRTIEKFQSTRASMRVGTIGLGAGTLAAYARPGDTYDFWDIDPKSIRIARSNFTFVAESAGKINLLERDGRQGLEESKADYDLIIVDAFTGSGVPSHLLTTEAINLYFRRLSARDGLLLVNVSTRYTRLFPIIEATARATGHAAIHVVTDITDSLTNRDWDPTHTEYVVVCRPEQARDIALWFPIEEEKGRIRRYVGMVDSPLVNSQLVWSDDRTAALDTVDLGVFLFSP